jgi:hypothetical protein
LDRTVKLRRSQLNYRPRAARILIGNGRRIHPVRAPQAANLLRPGKTDRIKNRSMRVLIQFLEVSCVKQKGGGNAENIKKRRYPDRVVYNISILKSLEKRTKNIPHATSGLKAEARYANGQRKTDSCGG